MDQYLDTLEFATKEIFSITGISANEIQSMFISKNCLEKSLSNIALGNYKLAFKILAFAFATYPSNILISYGITFNISFTSFCQLSGKSAATPPGLM